jgi:ABC-type sugar transport system ATPase subunit
VPEIRVLIGSEHPKLPSWLPPEIWLTPQHGNSCGIFLALQFPGALDIGRDTSTGLNRTEYPRADARIEQLGTPSELYFQPRSVFAATFLGESNIVEAMVAAVEGDRLVLRTNGDVTVHARAVPGISPGTHLSFVVQQADNVVEGDLKDVIMIGQVTRLYVRLNSGEELLSTRLTSGLNQFGARGSRVRLGWTSADTVLLRDGGAGA